MRYSFNLNKGNFVFAIKSDINSSYKDMSVVCIAVRYLKTTKALALINKVIDMEMPIPYPKYNTRMGSRHELGGKKGAYPRKAAMQVRDVILNAIANAKNKGLNGEEMYIMHASANKTQIIRRQPSKGSLFSPKGSYYGRRSMRHSDLELGKVEIGLCQGDEKELTDNMRYFIKKKNKIAGEIKSTAAAKFSLEKKDKKQEAKEKAKPELKIQAKPQVPKIETKTEIKPEPKKVEKTIPKTPEKQ